MAIETPPKASKPIWRFVNRDGSFNIDPASYQRAFFSDFYHGLLSARWRNLLLAVGAIYLLINLGFGSAFYFAGPQALEGIRETEPWGRFVECFFFSVQTLATIGYGRVSPVSLFAHALVTVEALTGLMTLAVVTGLVFARFSRPTARVIFSKNLLVSVIDGVPCLVFRMANARLNQMAEAQVSLTLARFEKTQEGYTYRNLYDLKLERNRSPMFAMTWVIIHELTSESPLCGATVESLQESESEIMVTVSGMDEAFSQTVQARHSYAVDDMVWGAEFVDVISGGRDGKIHVALDRIHEYRLEGAAQPFSVES